MSWCSWTNISTHLPHEYIFEQYEVVFKLCRYSHSRPYSMHYIYFYFLPYFNSSVSWISFYFVSSIDAWPPQCIEYCRLFIAYGSVGNTINESSKIFRNYLFRKELKINVRSAKKDIRPVLYPILLNLFAPYIFLFQRSIGPSGPSGRYFIGSFVPPGRSWFFYARGLFLLCLIGIMMFFGVMSWRPPGSGCQFCRPHI